MQIAKFKVAALTATIILAGTIGFYSVNSLLMRSYTIPTSGSIGLLETQPTGGYKSEIRALFVHAMSFINADWATMLQTAKNYDINIMVFEILGNNYARYPSAYIPWADYGFSTILSEAHSRGMEVYVSMNVMLSTPGDEYKVTGADGVLRDTLDPTNPLSRTLLKNLVEELVTNYDIDGFMYDYARYDSADVPYGGYARQSLEAYLGETITNFPGEFAPGGSRYNEFMEWRSHPINDLVRDMRNWMLAIKPDLVFSAAVWGWIPNYPTYNRYWIGQDSTYWVKEGYLDWVAPMMYTTDTNLIRERILDHQKYEGGPEGDVALVPFLSNAFPSTVDSNNFKQQIDTVRNAGADGWIIWRYGGPGDGEGSGAPDIRTYLDLVDLPQVFSLENIEIFPNEQAETTTITWTTGNPSTSKVEYSTSPLFNASFEYLAATDFSYWDIDHVVGTIVEDTTLVTSHSITLTGLQEGPRYYYRVQSEDQSGIATSEVYTFEL